jgi:hypothetical protein
VPKKPKVALPLAPLLAIVKTLGHLAWINLPSLREADGAKKSDDHCAHMIA